MKARVKLFDRHHVIATCKVVIQATLNPADLNKDYLIDYGLIGDAGLTLTSLVEAVREQLGGNPRGRSESIAQAIRASKDQWLTEWMPRLTSNEVPLSPYRVIWDLRDPLCVSPSS